MAKMDFENKLANVMGKSNVDSLFQSTDPNKTKAGELIKNISIENLQSFKNHPFKVKDDDKKMIEMLESIQMQGIINPIIVRAIDNSDKFEIIAGHRRTRACELLKIETIPAIIKVVDDDESTIIMVDSNIQREELLFSEKAFAYKMKLDALKRTAGRPKKNSMQVAQNLISKWSIEVVAEDVGTSKDQVRRYIRLTELINELLNMTDDRTLPFTTSVELSYLKKNEQKLVLKKIQELRKPSLVEAKKLKECSANGGVTEEFINGLLSSTDIKKSVSKDRPFKNMFVKNKIYDKYFSEDAEEEEIEKFIMEVLESYFENK